MKTAIDLVDVLAERLREAGFDDAGVRRLADLDRGGIAVRRIPSTTTATYYDGFRSVDYLCQVVVARESEAAAIDECAEIAQTVPTLDLTSQNGSYRLTSVGIYSDPQEISQPEDGIHVWAVRFKAIMTLKRKD